jgi:hypothetical protein
VTLNNQEYSEEHLQEVLEFVKRISPISEIIWGWDSGRFVDWHWGGNHLKLKEHPGWFSKNCRIFRKHGDLCALVVSEYGGTDACVLTEERNPRLVKDVVDWLLDHWAPERKGLSFEISHNEFWLSSMFEAAGLTEEQLTGHEWEYAVAQTPEASVLPVGYTLETLAVGSENALSGIAEVLQKAFQSKNTVEAIVDILRNLAKNPLFLPELNVFTRSPDGKIASYCRGTVNAENGIAAIDPVCCHPDFFRQGLAKATVQECFRRQAQLGGRLSYIGSAPMPAPSTFLYRSLMPRRYTTTSTFSLPNKENSK